MPRQARDEGASLEGGIYSGRVRKKEEKENHHIHELELWALEIALKTFLKERNPKLKQNVLVNKVSETTSRN